MSVEVKLGFQHELGDLVVALDTLLTESDPAIHFGLVTDVEIDEDEEYGVPGGLLYDVMWGEDGPENHKGLQRRYGCFQLVPADLAKRVIWGRAAQVEKHMNRGEIARVVTLLNEIDPEGRDGG